MKDAEIKVNLLSIGPFEHEFSRDPSQATAAQRGSESNTVNNNKRIWVIKFCQFVISFFDFVH